MPKAVSPDQEGVDPVDTTLDKLIVVDTAGVEPASSQHQPRTSTCVAEESSLAPSAFAASTRGVYGGRATRLSSRDPSDRVSRLAGYHQNLTRPTALPLFRRPGRTLFRPRLR